MNFLLLYFDPAHHSSPSGDASSPAEDEPGEFIPAEWSRVTRVRTRLEAEGHL
jgi:hypothetical protein